MDVLQVNFTASNTVLDPKPYTVFFNSLLLSRFSLLLADVMCFCVQIYELEIRSSSTITWVIYKRYSDFDTVHQAVRAQPVCRVLVVVYLIPWFCLFSCSKHFHISPTRFQLCLPKGLNLFSPFDFYPFCC
jgi:hypothetical protein